MDNPYQTPNGSENKPANPQFQTTSNPTTTPGGVADPSYANQCNDPSNLSDPDCAFTQEFKGDKENTWDSSVVKLLNFLDDGAGGYDEFVLFFNNNQVNSGASTNQNLVAFARVTLCDATETTCATFDFTNNRGAGGTPGGDVASYTYGDISQDATVVAPPMDMTEYAGSAAEKYHYVVSGGQVCTDATATNIDPECDDPNHVSFNHNLGANQAAYALWSPELNAALRSATYAGGTLHADIRMGALNNGYEQIFAGKGILGETPPPPEVPEPASVALMGLGLLGLAGLRRKANRLAA